MEIVIPWQLCRTIGPLTLHSQEITQIWLTIRWLTISPLCVNVWTVCKCSGCMAFPIKSAVLIRFCFTPGSYVKMTFPFNSDHNVTSIFIYIGTIRLDFKINLLLSLLLMLLMLCRYVCHKLDCVNYSSHTGKHVRPFCKELQQNVQCRAWNVLHAMEIFLTQLFHGPRLPIYISMMI